MPIEGLTYTNEVVRLADLFTVRNQIDGLKFVDCFLVGPAVITFTETITLSGCSFNGPPNGLLIEIERGRPLVGILVFRNAQFFGCRFENVGIASDREFAGVFMRDLMRA